LAAVTVTVAAAPGPSSPGGGQALNAYCVAPGPDGADIDHVRFAGPSLRTRNDWALGATPPHVAPNDSDDGATPSLPPIPFPVTESPEGNAPHTAPVAVIAMVPTATVAVVGANVTLSDCTLPLGTVSVVDDSANGAAVESATLAGALPSFLTRNDCVADAKRTTSPKLPKLGVACVSNDRTAPFGCSVIVIECDVESASV
jgi:hypothetical protein